MESTSNSVTPAQARAIAKEAFIYGYPIVDNMRIQQAYFVDQTNAEYKVPYNHLFNISQVYTPADKALQTPNSDTPYSWVGLDLRAEPIVFTAPAMEKERYWCAQLIDLYTHNFDYIGTRNTGNEGGNYMIAGPGWAGATPADIVKVIHCETQLALSLWRTQLFNPGDIENVRQIQAQYKAQPLSAFLGQPAPTPAPAIHFPVPLPVEQMRASLGIFSQLNFALQFCPPHPSEQALLAEFAKIGVGAGLAFDASALPAEMQQALGAGIADAWADFREALKLAAAGKLTSGDVFGTREYMQGKYLYRMIGAVQGIYGNSKEEAIYPVYYVDSEGQKLSGANTYVLQFSAGQLPPVHAFWSLTMYDEASLLVDNSLDRYLLNSTMASQFVRDADGGVTLYLQHESPGKDKEPNWLPAPSGVFTSLLRLYLPKEEVQDGTWKQPALQRIA